MGTIAVSIIAVLCGALFVLFVFVALCVAILNTHSSPAAIEAGVAKGGTRRPPRPLVPPEEIPVVQPDGAVSVIVIEVANGDAPSISAGSLL